MMNSTERDSKFVAGLAAQGPWLHVPKMMRVGRLATAEQAGLLGNVAKMRFVAIAAGGGMRERTLVDAFGLMTMLGSDRSQLFCGRRGKGVVHD
jgi:hypothetical protein